MGTCGSKKKFIPPAEPAKVGFDIGGVSAACVSSKKNVESGRSMKMSVVGEGVNPEDVQLESSRSGKLKRQYTHEQLEARAQAAAKRATLSGKEGALRKALDDEADAAGALAASSIVHTALELEKKVEAEAREREARVKADAEAAAAAAAAAEAQRLGELAAQRRAEAAAEAEAREKEAKAKAEADAGAEAAAKEAAVEAAAKAKEEAEAKAKAASEKQPSEKAVEVWTKKVTMALSKKGAATTTGIGVNAITSAGMSTVVLAQHFVRGADANKMLSVMGERQSPKTAAKRHKTTETLQAALDYYAEHKDDSEFVHAAWKMVGPE